MNLVIDDAVEVTLANAKKETPEERRSIGAYSTRKRRCTTNGRQAKFCSKATTSPSSNSCNKLPEDDSTGGRSTLRYP